MAEIKCDDCGAPMEERRLCLLAFVPVDNPEQIYGYQRLSNLCERCRERKIEDVAKRYPPRIRDGRLV